MAPGFPRSLRTLPAASLLAAGALFHPLALQGGAAAAPLAALPSAPAAAFDVAAAEAQFLDLLNADRMANGLAPLQMDPRLMDVARWRSEDMVARNYFGHDIGGLTIFQVLSERQIRFRVAGENIAYNTFDEARTIAVAQSGLMSSAGHRANILRSEFNMVGVGIAVAPDGKVVYTQVFIQG